MTHCFCEKWNRLKHRGVICDDCCTEVRIGGAIECSDTFLIPYNQRDMNKFWIAPFIAMTNELAFYAFEIIREASSRKRAQIIGLASKCYGYIMGYICADDGESITDGWQRWQITLWQRRLR